MNEQNESLSPLQLFTSIGSQHLQAIHQMLQPNMQLVLVCFDPDDPQADICLTTKPNVTQAIEALQRCETRRFQQLAEGMTFGEDGMPVEH